MARIMTESPDFIKTFQSLCNNKYQTWQVWSDFVLLGAITISNACDKANFEDREKLYHNIIAKYTKSEAAIFPQLLAYLVMALEHNKEQDFLGSLYMQLNLGNYWKGQFFTPYDVCVAMSSLTSQNILEQVKEKGYITVNDPACGAGATLIAFANAAESEFYQKKSKLNWQNHVLFVAQDIDMVTGLMCYLQLSFLGCAGFVKIGDTLSDPMTSNDDISKYWYTPMYYSDVWQLRRIFHNMDNIGEPKKEKQEIKESIKKEPSPPTYIIKLKEKKTGQLALF